MTKRTTAGLIAASLLLVISVGASAYGWWQQRVASENAAMLEVTNQDLAAAVQTAETEADKARAAEREALAQESRALAALAQGEIRGGYPVEGMLLALRGMPIAEAEEPRPVVTETRQALVDAMLAQRELLVLHRMRGESVLLGSPGMPRA